MYELLFPKFLPFYVRTKKSPRKYQNLGLIDSSMNLENDLATYG
jgi:hypothetical protein